MNARVLRAFAACVLAAALQPAAGCVLNCTGEMCSGSRLRVSFESDAGALPPGHWRITARVEDGILEAECTVDASMTDPLSCPVRWTTPPSRDLDASLTFTPNIETGDESYAAEAFLTVVHPERGPAEVTVDVAVGMGPTRSASYALEYPEEPSGEEGCPTCPRNAFETLIIDA